MRLPPYLSKLAAIAILLAVIAPFMLLVLWYAGLLDGQAERTDELRARLGRFEAVAAYAGSLDGVDERAGSAIGTDWFLEQGSPTLVLANLQARLKSIAAGQGLEVRQAREAPSITRDGAVYLGVELDMAGPLASLDRLLAEIDASRPLLFIERARLDSGTANFDPRLEPMLDVSLAVYGATQGASPAASP